MGNLPYRVFWSWWRMRAVKKLFTMEKFITRFAKVYTPTVVFLAIALVVLPMLFIPDAVFADWLYRALTFLVVSCPCALVISVPLGMFAGIGAASKSGILIKGGNYLGIEGYRAVCRSLKPVL